MDGNLVALVVAVFWTLCALFFEFGSRRIGSLNLNLVRLVFGFIFLGTTIYFIGGSFLPIGADGKTWFLMCLSGVIGFVLGDYFLFESYTLITARFSQLFMTLAPLFTAVFSFAFLKEGLGWKSVCGILITLSGIAISIYGSSGNGEKKAGLSLPLKGCIFAILGAFGQGLGLVLSKMGMGEYEAVYNSPSAIYIPLASTQIRCITGIVCFALIIVLKGGAKDFAERCRDLKGLSLTLAGSVFGPFLGVTLSLLAVQHSDTAVASTIMAMVPVLILIPEKYILKRTVTWRQFVGAVIAVLGISLFFV